MVYRSNTFIRQKNSSNSWSTVPLKKKKRNKNKKEQKEIKLLYETLALSLCVICNVVKILGTNYLKRKKLAEHFSNQKILLKTKRPLRWRTLSALTMLFLLSTNIICYINLNCTFDLYPTRTYNVLTMKACPLYNFSFAQHWKRPPTGKEHASSMNCQIHEAKASYL